MSADPSARCALCGRTCDEEIQVGEVGAVCSECAMAGRFLPSAGLRLSAAAALILDRSAAAGRLLNAALDDTEELANRREYDRARERLLAIARGFIGARPLLAATVLFRTLRLPGQAAEVYELLGQAALAMQVEREALQHLKTAAWLCEKSGRQDVLQRVLQSLRRLAPGDDWAQDAARRAGETRDDSAARCAFCGRGAEDAGPLIAGSQAAICSQCLQRLSNQDGQTH